jgi:hypothetical protein
MCTSGNAARRLPNVEWISFRRSAKPERGTPSTMTDQSQTWASYAPAGAAAGLALTLMGLNEGLYAAVSGGVLIVALCLMLATTPRD